MFVVSKLILLFTKAGWSAQSYFLTLDLSNKPSVDTVFVALCALFEAVWIHRRHDVDPGRVDQPPDPVIGPVRLQQVLHQQEKHLTADGLVAVHVADVFELWKKT